MQLGQLVLTALLLVALVTAWLGVVCVTIPVNFVVRKRLRHPRISNQDSPLERQQLSPQQFFILRLGLVQLLGIITRLTLPKMFCHINLDCSGRCDKVPSIVLTVVVSSSLFLYNQELICSARRKENGKRKEQFLFSSLDACKWIILLL